MCITGEVDEYLIAKKYIAEQQAEYTTRAQLKEKYISMVGFLRQYVEENK